MRRIPLGLPAVVSVLLMLLLTGSARSEVVINEVDYDQPAMDTAEFIELLNLGPGTADLSQYVLQLVNGTDGVVYQTFPLPAVSIVAGECFVICGNGGTVSNCGYQVAFAQNWIQNGAPDAVGLRHNGILVDAVSYEGSTAGYTEASGVGLIDDGTAADVAIARTPDGTDTDKNNVDFTARAATPGTPCAVSKVVISEVDYDQPGPSDTAEFIELLNTGSFSVNLVEYHLELVNGFDGAIYQNIPLPNVILPPKGCFVVCGTGGAVANCNYQVGFASNWIQNGAPDAIGLRHGSLLVDAVSYEGNTTAYTEGSGVGLIDDGTTVAVSIARKTGEPDTDINNNDFVAQAASPADCHVVGVPIRPGSTPSARMTAAPNPFSARTLFEFTTPRAGRAELNLYDPSGRLVRRVFDATGEAGLHRAEWDGRDDAGRSLPPGPYFYGLKVDGQLVGARKLMLLR